MPCCRVCTAAKGSAFTTPLHACCHVQDAGALAFYKQAELIHCRLAMTAVAGVLVTSILHKAGTGVPEWFDAGEVYNAKPDVSM